MKPLSDQDERTEVEHKTRDGSTSIKRMIVAGPRNRVQDVYILSSSLAIIRKAVAKGKNLLDERTPTDWRGTLIIMASLPSLHQTKEPNTGKLAAYI